MDFIKKTIASLLVICMMFSLVPGEMLTNVFAHGAANTVSQRGTKGTAGKAGDTRNWQAIIRVSLSRDPNHQLDGTREAYDNLLKIYSAKYPNPGELTNSLYFMDSDDYSRSTSDFSKMLFCRYEQSPSSGLVYEKSEQLLRAVVSVPRSSPKASNAFFEKVKKAKNDKIISSTDDLAGYKWKAYLPDEYEARALCNYLFRPVEGFQDRVKAVTVPWFYEFRDPETLTDDEKFQT